MLEGPRPRGGHRGGAAGPGRGRRRWSSGFRQRWQQRPERLREQFARDQDLGSRLDGPGRQPVRPAQLALVRRIAGEPLGNPRQLGLSPLADGDRDMSPAGVLRAVAREDLAHHLRLQLALEDRERHEIPLAGEQSGRTAVGARDLLPGVGLVGKPPDEAFARLAANGQRLQEELAPIGEHRHQARLERSAQRGRFRRGRESAGQAQKKE